MEFINSKIFPYIVATAAGAVAFSAAFFSVFGLSKLFAGAELPKSIISLTGLLHNLQLELSIIIIV